MTNEMTEEQCKEMDQDIKQEHREEVIAEAKEEEFNQWKLDHDSILTMGFQEQYEDEWEAYCKEQFHKSEE